ncbi:hypothetical protein DFH29DRAFT_872920 [Suillus ampliporus]|nr:hypothetical protein DFH29DRAFT_872920 [Suillus ampliporus]
MLIDWEFAVDIADDHQYNHGGTGTVPFMSQALLGQMVQARAMQHSKQDFTDDLKSLFYVFLWICIMFSGPLGNKRQWKLGERCIPYEWNRQSLHLCQSSKVMFFTRSMDGLSQFDPYFHDLLPLTQEWTDLLKFNFAETDADSKVRRHDPMKFEDVIEILDKHLALLPDNEPSPGHVLRKRGVEEQIKDKIIKDMHSTGIAMQKHILDDVWTVEPAKRILSYVWLPQGYRGQVMLPGTIMTTSLKTCPKKKRAKCKGSDVTAPSGQGKKSRQATTAADAPALNLVLLQLTTDANDILVPHCSGRSGAGTGGRNVQLEKVVTILEAPTQMTQRKGSTTMPPNVPANPLAPESYCKGRGGHAQNPPPYNFSEIAGTITASSNWKGKKTKTPSAPNSQGLVQVTYGPSLGPGFLLHEADGHFGFDPWGNPPMVPPGTEPDLQVLNNPYIAMARSAAERHACATPPVLGNEDVLQSAPPSQSHSMSTSTSIQPSSVAMSMHNFEELLEPSLQSVSHQPGDNVRSQGMESRDSDTLSADESDESNGDANGGSKEFSWAEVGKHHGAHPGFSREVEASHQVHATSTLVPEFEFQYSRDEGDMDAEENLASVDHSSDKDTTRGIVDHSQVQHSHFYTPRGTQVLEGFKVHQLKSIPKPNDVLDQHHNKNGCPCLPDPASLELLHDAAERKDPKSSSGKVVIKEPQSAKFKGSSDGLKPIHLAFYPAHWKSFLKEAKGECWAQHALEKPFLSLVNDILGSISEALMSILILWDQAGKLFEPDIYPLHKPDMAMLLYDDLATWCSDLKKSINILVPTMYNLVPPLNMPLQECTAWVECCTAELLDLAVFLHNGVDEHYHCILDGLTKDGSRNSCPKFTAKNYSPIYSGSKKVWEYNRAIGTCLNASHPGLNLRYAVWESDVMERRYGYSSLVTH